MPCTFLDTVHSWKKASSDFLKITLQKQFLMNAVDLWRMTRRQQSLRKPMPHRAKTRNPVKANTLYQDLRLGPFDLACICIFVSFCMLQCFNCAVLFLYMPPHHQEFVMATRVAQECTSRTCREEHGLKWLCIIQASTQYTLHVWVCNDLWIFWILAATSLRDSAPQVTTRHLQRAFAPSKEVLGSPYLGGNGPRPSSYSCSVWNSVSSGKPPYSRIGKYEWLFLQDSLSLSLWISPHLSHSENLCRKML